MSSPVARRRADGRVERTVHDPRGVVAPRASLYRALARVAFWVAVVLPAVYLPLAFVGARGDATLPVVGTVGVGELLLLSLVCLHALVVLLGHAHTTEERRGGTP